MPRKKKKFVAVAALLATAVVSIVGGMVWAIADPTGGPDLFTHNWILSSGLVFGLCVCAILYFAPTFMAWDRGGNVTAVFLMNLLLGWTFVGWILAAMWANKTPDRGM